KRLKARDTFGCPCALPSNANLLECERSFHLRGRPEPREHRGANASAGDRRSSSPHRAHERVHAPALRSRQRRSPGGVRSCGGGTIREPEPGRLEVTSALT